MPMENYFEYYEDALKKGKRSFKQAVSAGEYPYLPVLDEIIPDNNTCSVRDAGYTEIPQEWVIGTKTAGRTRSFARNFMPVVGKETEFAAKWYRLCEAHLTEGIRDPVLVTEYMNRYYVQEGNKRVSVLKYFGADKIPAYVRQIIPNRTGDPEVEKYFALLDFREKTGIDIIELSKTGAYSELLAIMKKRFSDPWTEDEARKFTALYQRFRLAYDGDFGKHLKTTAADALLECLKVYEYEDLYDMSVGDLKTAVRKLWDQIASAKDDKQVELKLDPQEAPGITGKILHKIPLINTKKPLKAAFFYGKGTENSTWDASHEEGRQYIEKIRPDVETSVYVKNASESVEAQLEKIIADGAKVIFSIDSPSTRACARVAVEHPDVDILVCSLNEPYRSVRTYYPRAYEAKYVAGAVAGALSKDGKIGYICKYPIYGMIAEINAFARGVNLTNPDGEVWLEWSSLGGMEAAEARLKEKGISMISYRDFSDKRYGSDEYMFGIVDVADEKSGPLVHPIWNWGVIYDRLITSIRSGAYQEESKKTSHSLNYYWGMSSGAVDLRFSDKLPFGVRCLGDILCKGIRSGMINPFSKPKLMDDGSLRWDDEIRPDRIEEIITMDTLDLNVRGSIPEYDQLDNASKDLVEEIGVGPAKKKN